MENTENKENTNFPESNNTRDDSLTVSLLSLHAHFLNNLPFSFSPPPDPPGRRGRQVLEVRHTISSSPKASSLLSCGLFAFLLPRLLHKSKSHPSTLPQQGHDPLPPELRRTTKSTSSCLLHFRARFLPGNTLKIYLS